MKFTKKVLIFSVVFICFLAGSVFFLSANSEKSYTQVSNLLSAQDIKKSIDAKEDIILVDVRRQDEYDSGHLKSSVLLTLETIGEKAAEVIPDKNKKYYVYCRTGRRSAQAVSQLKQMGYTNIYDMSGGITEWQNSGFPVEK